MISDPPPGYRACVGAVVFNDAGLVLTGRRAGISDDGYAWQLPQGGLDDGEDPEEGARRELYEEMGVSSVSLLDQIDRWLSYDFPPEVLGKRFKNNKGQSQRWFAYAFEGNESEIILDGHGKPEFDDWAWRPLKSLPSLIVPFKRNVYEAIVTSFQPIAVRRGHRGV